jgi:hypothetical protein
MGDFYIFSIIQYIFKIVFNLWDLYYFTLELQLNILPIANLFKMFAFSIGNDKRGKTWQTVAENLIQRLNLISSNTYFNAYLTIERGIIRFGRFGALSQIVSCIFQHIE